MEYQKLDLVAYQIGEKIQLKNFKNLYEGTTHSFSSTEIFIMLDEYSYIYLQNSGEIAFANCNENTIKEFLNFIKQFVETPIAIGKEYKENFIIKIVPEEPLHFNYDTIHVPICNADVIKIALLNVSQSVVLDYFTELTQLYLKKTSRYTHEMQTTGKLKLSNKELMKFIGTTLHTQNRIVDNLYFIDAPDTVWENEYLSKINHGLSSIFNIKTRFKEVEYTLKIIDTNLRTFAQLVQHRDNKKLELVVIFLILFEVLQAIFDKFIPILH